MMVANFIQQLQERYPDLNQSVEDDIYALVSLLTDSQRDYLWDRFLDTYSYNSPPKRAVFAKLMAESGINKKIESQYVFYEYCTACSVGYPIEIGTCYYCGKELSLHQAKRYPENYIKIHEHCAECQRFEPGQTMGAMCDLWGVPSDLWGLEGNAFTQQKKKCKDCPCKVCCREERLSKNDYKLYIDMRDNGRFEGGFIPRDNNNKNYKE